MTTGKKAVAGVATRAMQEPEPVATPTPFKPHTQMGRSGYLPDTESALGLKVKYLDALLCLMFGAESDGTADCMRMNPETQMGCLNLSSARQRDEFLEWSGYPSGHPYRQSVGQLLAATSVADTTLHKLQG